MSPIHDTCPIGRAFNMLDESPNDRHRWRHMMGLVLRGHARRLAGRLCGNRLLEFEGRQDCLAARIAFRLARTRLRTPAAVSTRP